MNPRGVWTLLGFNALAVIWSRGDAMNLTGVRTLLGFMASAAH